MTTSIPVEIREADIPCDGSRILNLDRSFTSKLQYVVVWKDALPCLRIQKAPSPITKSFPIDFSDPTCDIGYVAVDHEKLCGFIAGSFQSWNRRLVVRHFYVDLPYRLQGVGKHLMARMIEVADKMNASMIWLETSNTNGPGIQAYKRLGFSICGFDLTLYESTPNEGEFGLYLARHTSSSPVKSFAGIQPSV